MGKKSIEEEKDGIVCMPMLVFMMPNRFNDEVRLTKLCCWVRNRGQYQWNLMSITHPG